MVQQTDGVYRSSLLSKFSGLVHGFSTRIFCDARIREHEDAILRSVGAQNLRIIGVKQVHGSNILVVDSYSGRIAGQADALMSQSVGIALVVHVADCVPIILFDSRKRIVAAIHAGWKGTKEEIVRKTVRVMCKHGADPHNVLAVIGPHIGACCYTVESARAAFFADTAALWQGLWHVDLGQANRLQLLKEGVTPNHIDAAIACTSCQKDVFFSYRKDTKETFGEMAAIIGMKNV